MQTLAPILSTITAAFLASFVESSKAFTIVLAVGVTRGWRPALTGAATGAGAAGGPGAGVRPLLALVPITTLQVRRRGAVDPVRHALAAKGYPAQASASSPCMTKRQPSPRKPPPAPAGQRPPRRLPCGAGIVQGGAARGVEVVFIVIAVGAAHGQTLYASLGALAAFVLVMLIGLAVHRPLARVPENALQNSSSG